jgi:hypothetical protein
MKSLKTTRNTLIITGSILIALIQLLCIYVTRMDAINIISFTIIQYLYMDLVKVTFDKKIEELTTKNSGK